MRHDHIESILKREGKNSASVLRLKLLLLKLNKSHISKQISLPPHWKSNKRMLSLTQRISIHHCAQQLTLSNMLVLAMSANKRGPRAAPPALPAPPPITSSLQPLLIPTADCVIDSLRRNLQLSCPSRPFCTCALPDSECSPRLLHNYCWIRSPKAKKELLWNILCWLLAQDCCSHPSHRGEKP